MLKTRILTGLIALPILIILIREGQWLFIGAMLVIAGSAIWEYIYLLRIKGHRPSLILALSLAVAAILDITIVEADIFLPATTLLTLGAWAWQLFWATEQTSVANWALTLAGGLYIGLGFGHVIALRFLPEGQAWAWLVLFCAWGNDTAAYFGGRTWGRHALWPRWSPSKTWEGVIAGTMGGMAGAAVVAYFSTIPLVHALILGCLTAVVGPLGDLSESMIKRYTGAKDASRFLPGHGGVLDRMDSLIFVGVVMFYYVSWVVL